MITTIDVFGVVSTSGMRPVHPAVNTSSTAIYDLFCPIDICNEIFVTQSTFFYQIYLSAEESFQGVTKIEIVGDVIPFFMVGGIVSYKKVHIAPLIKSVCQDRSEDSKRLDLVSAAKVKYALQIQFNQLHDRICNCAELSRGALRRLPFLAS